MKKKILTLIMAAIVSLSVFAVTPDNNGDRKLSRQERKELREKEAIENAAIMKDILESRHWVLEADRLRDRYGNSEFVDSGINFVSITGENAVVQLGVTDELGLNGVGGITVEGKVSKYEVKQGRKPTSGMSLILSVSGGAIGHSTIHFNISPNGNATATVSTIDGGKLTYNGKVVSLNESRVFKGSTTY